MVLASHQPDFFPYLGYFYKIWQSDVFVFSDNVLYSKSGRHNYNEILTGNGPMRFTLPIGQHTWKLNDIQIKLGEKELQKMCKTLWQEYHNAYHYKAAANFIESLLYQAENCSSLADFNMLCITSICEESGWTETRKFLKSSDLDLKERRDARIIEMCKLLDADTYYSGSGAKDYHIEADYTAAGINLVYSDYQPLEYPQKPSRHLDAKFRAPNMSVIDYMMNCGINLPWG